jgi:membrane-bound metal-dependent hydrolase YbcI (DUF457 family)
MFVGHTAVALAAKAKTPNTSLGLLIAAAIVLDLLWPIFLLVGIEHVRIDPGNTAFTPLAFDSYPWSHSLLMAIVWGVGFAVIIRPGRSSLETGLILFALVVSHWILDFVTHRPDLPLWPGSSPKYGLGLWNSIPASLVIEAALLATCIAIYLRTTQARDRIGTIAFWTLVVVQLGIWVSQPWSPPPPSVDAIAPVGLAQFLFVLWAWWIDKHRRQRRV